MLCALPALTVGLVLDDLKVQAWLAADPATRVSFWDLSVVVFDDPRLTTALRADSTYPWWTLPELKIAFFRPLHVALLTFDLWLFEGAPAAMHLHQLVYYGLACAAAAGVYCAIESSRKLAAIMAFLFAVDGTHAVAATWLSMRGALLGTALGYGALFCHIRWRRGWRPGKWLAPAALFVGLLGAEMTTACVGLLVAYAVVLDPGTPSERARSLVPAALSVVAWRVLYAGLGYGTQGSGFYLDPSSQPVEWALALPSRATWLTAIEIGPALRAFLGNPLTDGAVWIAFGAGVALTLGIVGFALRAGSERRRVVFWLVAFALSVLTMTTASPSEPVTFGVTLASSALVGHGLMALFAYANTARRLSWAGRALAWAGTALHAGVSPLLLGYGAYSVGRNDISLRFSSAPALGNDAALAEQDVIVLHAASSLHALVIPGERRRIGAVAPRRTWLLGSGSTDVLIEREGERSLRLLATGGYRGDPFWSFFRSERRPLTPGTTLELDGMHVLVERVADARPESLLVSFPEPLSTSRYRLLAWAGDDYAEVPVPTPGHPTRLRAGQWKGSE